MILNFIEARNGNGLDGVVGHAGDTRELGEITPRDLSFFDGLVNFGDLGSADVNETDRRSNQPRQLGDLARRYFRDGTKIESPN